MYSIIECGGFQHKVVLGESIKVPKIDAVPGSDITIAQVLLWANGEDVKVGAPYLPQSSVTAEILSHGKDDKVRVFKRKRRKSYRRTQGHRQQFTEILIKEFISENENLKAESKNLVRERARSASLSKKKSNFEIKTEVSSETVGS